MCVLVCVCVCVCVMYNVIHNIYANMQEYDLLIAAYHNLPPLSSLSDNKVGISLVGGQRWSTHWRWTVDGGGGLSMGGGLSLQATDVFCRL